MKYLLLALTSIAIAATFTGCGDDLNHNHDIYRAQYENYKPLPQADVAAPTPRNAPADDGSLPPPAAAPVPGGLPPQ